MSNSCFSPEVVKSLRFTIRLESFGAIDSYLPKIVSLKNLTSIELVFTKQTWSDFLFILESLPHLKSLDLWYTHLLDTPPKYSEKAINALKRLTHFNLYNEADVNDDDYIELYDVLSESKNLTSLRFHAPKDNLPVNRYFNRFVKEKLPEMITLQSLQLGRDLTPDQTKEFSRLTNLSNLDLAVESKSTAVIPSDILEKFTTLQELTDLRFVCYFQSGTPKGLLKPLAKNKKLTSLAIQGTGNPSSLEWWGVGDLLQITTLHLALHTDSNNVACLPALTNLTKLTCSFGTPTLDEKFLDIIQTMTTLKELRLNNTVNKNLSRSPAFARLCNLTNLEKLTVAFFSSLYLGKQIQEEWLVGFSEEARKNIIRTIGGEDGEGIFPLMKNLKFLGIDAYVTKEKITFLKRMLPNALFRLWQGKESEHDSA